MHIFKPFEDQLVCQTCGYASPDTPGKISEVRLAKLCDGLFRPTSVFTLSPNRTRNISNHYVAPPNNPEPESMTSGVSTTPTRIFSRPPISPTRPVSIGTASPYIIKLIESRKQFKENDEKDQTPHPVPVVSPAARLRSNQLHTSAEKCLVWGHGLGRIRPGVPAFFTLITRTRGGQIRYNPYDEIRVSVDEDDLHLTIISRQNHKNGCYEVSFMLAQAYTFLKTLSVRIFVNNIPIPQNPFLITVGHVSGAYHLCFGKNGKKNGDFSQPLGEQEP